MIGLESDVAAARLREALSGAGRSEGRCQPQTAGAYGPVREYWNRQVHDLRVTTHAVGTPEFFRELEAYRYGKLDYLVRLLRAAAQPGRRVLEVGCGVGTDLVQFAASGSQVTGIELSSTALDLARLNLAQRGLPANLACMDGEALGFAAEVFDLVYAHGVLPYTPDATRLLREIHRVLRPGGAAIVMVYNRHSWLSAMSGLTRVRLEHADAPILTMHSMATFRRLLRPFAEVQIIAERFPVATRLHHGLKARLFNTLFVQAFGIVPKALTRSLGWHLVARAVK